MKLKVFYLLVLSFCLILPSARAESAVSYRLTHPEYKTILYTEPESFRVVVEVPPHTEVLVLDKKVIQQGKFKVNWYEVQYEDKTGWMRGSDFKDSVSESKYSVSYSSPGSDTSRPLTGTSF